MALQNLKLKTIFCCMSCDGKIATEEVKMIKQMTSETAVFDGIDTASLLNSYIAEINKSGNSFLKGYLKELSESRLSTDDQLDIIDLAIKTIEADNIIEYSEIKFFKKIRSVLTVSDEQILAKHPDKEDFLLPDVNISDFQEWDNVCFENISFDIITSS